MNIMWRVDFNNTAVYGCTSIFSIGVVFTHCRWFCADTCTCSLRYPCLWFQVFDQEGFFANLNAEASTFKIFVNFRVFFWKSYHLRIVYPHIFSLHERLSRILLILSWCFHEVPWWSILTILIAYNECGRNIFFFKTWMSEWVKNLHQTVLPTKPGSTPYIRNVDMWPDQGRDVLTDVTRSK